MPMSVVQKLRETFRGRQALTPEQYLEKLLRKGLHPDGTPILDPTPMAPPIGYKKHPSMVEIVRDMVRGERLKQLAEESGHETFEESEDFDVEDEQILRSQWENEFDPPLPVLIAAGREAIAEREKQALQKTESTVVSEVPAKPERTKSPSAAGGLPQPAGEG